MNKQFKIVNGVKTNSKIEWTDWTWNPVTGCQHDCRWTMPDGSVARCYAKDVYEKFLAGKMSAGGLSPEHFETVTFHPERLDEPLAVKEPARIFLDSMSDLMGRGVTDETIHAVLDICAQADWHTFQLLTKNPARLAKFQYPANVWVGASVPPTFMYGSSLDANQRVRFLDKTLEVLSGINVPVRWMSIEPLSWDVSPFFRHHPLQWVVIGAASNGPKIYQPKPEWVTNLLRRFALTQTPVFFKGNLKWAADQWREEFPIGARREPVPKLHQLGLF